MPIVAALRADFARIPISRHSNRRHRKCPKIFISPVMKDDSKVASNDRKNGKEEISKRLDRRSEPQRLGFQSEPPDLRFDRLQLPDEKVDCKFKRVFGRYIAREALLDEEFWTAAWLRAESHWEFRSATRHVDTFKRQFAEQEFNAIKRRCTGQQLTEMSTCLIVVKKEETNVKRTVLSSIVGTLDINIRHLLFGETFPGERMKATSCSIIGRKDQPIYGYVANLSVAKYARRQGIASNMLLLAQEAAKSYGANDVYVHVYKDNMAAWNLYLKLGFEMVERAIPQFEEEQKYLLCLKT